MERQKIKSEVQRLIVGYLEGLGVSQRAFAKMTGVSGATYGTYRRMTSAMGIDVLDKILAEYPGLKEVLMDHLRENNSENGTHAHNGTENKQNQMDAKETFYKELIENNQEYTIMPKALLKDYKMVPDKIIDIITQGIEAKNELVIDGLRNKIDRLEKEKEELQRQIPTKDK